MDECRTFFDMADKSVVGLLITCLYAESLTFAVHSFSIIADADTVLILCRLQSAVIFSYDVFLCDMVICLIDIDFTGQDDVILVMFQYLKQFEKPVFDGGIGDPGVS